MGFPVVFPWISSCSCSCSWMIEIKAYVSCTLSDGKDDNDNGNGKVVVETSSVFLRPATVASPSLIGYWGRHHIYHYRAFQRSSVLVGDPRWISAVHPPFFCCKYDPTLTSKSFVPKMWGVQFVDVYHNHCDTSTVSVVPKSGLKQTSVYTDHRGTFDTLLRCRIFSF